MKKYRIFVGVVMDENIGLSLGAQNG